MPNLKERIAEVHGATSEVMEAMDASVFDGRNSFLRVVLMEGMEAGAGM